MARCYLPLPSGVNGGGGGDRDETTSDAGSDRANETLENSTDAPLVNGTAGSKDGSVADKVSKLPHSFYKHCSLGDALF